MWAEPDADHVIELMRYVYAHRDEAQQVGLKAAETVSTLTWRHSNGELIKILRKVGMVP